MDKDEVNEDDESLYDEIRLEDELYAEQIESHPEYADFFEQSQGLDDVYLDADGQEVNPHLHLTLHVMVEKQLRSDDPPFVRKTFERLTARGLDGHEAQHAIMGVLVQLTWDVLTQQQPFDTKRYERELERL